MDVPGLMSRSVDCCKELFNLMKGKDINDSTSIECETELNEHKFNEIKEIYSKNQRSSFQFI